MVRHLVTVCVVCVLCATNTPCLGHADMTLDRNEGAPYRGQDASEFRDDIGTLERAKIDGVPGGEDRRGRRHALEVKEYFLTQLLKTYGDGESMTIEGFERLVRNLNLQGLVNEFQEVGRNNKSGNIKDGRDITKGAIIEKTQDPDKKCLKSRELLSFVSQNSSYETNENVSVSDSLFEKVCPALIYQLAGESGSDDCIAVPENHIDSLTYSHDHKHDQKPQNIVHVWVYSSISILIISLCGLLGVAVIPIMGKSYYNQVLQFLVALAVGCLCGDALIHLLPHAMIPAHPNHGHSHEEVLTSVDLRELHNQNMWKGFSAMIGIVMFFFMEKALNMITEWRKRVQKRKKLPTRVKIMRETDTEGANVVGEKLCKHKYSPYPYCYGEIASDNQENHDHKHNHVLPPEEHLALNANSMAKIMEEEMEKEKKECQNWEKDEAESNLAKHAQMSETKESESYTVILREHETKHHGHTHSHGHVHSAPDSLSSVAWMVVMGDGLHNFADGMAIGAAFSANIAGGFSTAIAVFCHELPHELGDFAVLLKAGMSAKQAVFYNLLSSVLCIFGMVFGILLGTTSANSGWMFSVAAGMFIYIALVDMVPELSSSHTSEGGSQWQFILQALGLISGFSIMLIIALYEHDLEHLFVE